MFLCTAAFVQHTFILNNLEIFRIVELALYQAWFFVKLNTNSTFLLAPKVTTFLSYKGKKKLRSWKQNRLEFKMNLHSSLLSHWKSAWIDGHNVLVSLKFDGLKFQCMTIADDQTLQELRRTDEWNKRTEHDLFQYYVSFSTFMRCMLLN